MMGFLPVPFWMTEIHFFILEAMTDADCPSDVSMSRTGARSSGIGLPIFFNTSLAWATGSCEARKYW